jgi:phosphatidylglycerol lysyltransferase
MITRIGKLIRRAPGTTALVALLWIIGGATGTLISGPGPAMLDRIGLTTDTLNAGPLWTPLTSMLWCGNLSGYLVTTVLLITVLAPAEHRLGLRRTAVFFVASQVIGAVTGTALVRLGADAGLWWYTSIDDEHALGPSIGAVGVALALSFRLPALWARRVRVFTLVALIMMTLYVGSFEDILRLTGAVAGLVVGMAVLGRSRRWPGIAMASTETRTLMAIVLAASAVGPLIALLTRNAFGPLSELQYLFSSPTMDAATFGDLCGNGGTGADCRTMQAMVRSSGIGPAITSVAPALIVVVIAEGLRRGRRFAWVAALALNLALIALIGIDLVDALITPDIEFADLDELGGKAGYLMFVAPLMIMPIMLVTALVLGRRHFDVAAPIRTYRRLGLVVGGTLLLTALADVFVGYLVRAEYRPAPSLVDLLADLPTRYIPTGYLFLNTASFLPVGPVASTLYDYTGAVFWTVALIGVLLTFWRVRLRSGKQDAAKAFALLREHGGSSLSYMTMWPGNHYWFSEDGRCTVAYRVRSTVALTTGDPIGPAEALPEAFHAFAEFCRQNGWMPCFYSVTERFRDLAVAADWKSVQVAEDTVLPLAELTFTGKKWQDVRTALNKAEKQGVAAEWCDYETAPLAIKDQVRTISEAWTATKGLPEMGFTLGGMAELADAEVRCLIAVDADRTVHGIISWLPVYRDGKPVGWTLDFMRRRANCFSGSMEFLIASSALRFQQEGAEFLSLSGAPLARLDRGAHIGTLQRVLDRTGRALEPVYGFGSLLAFKSKFQPVYRPLYLIYPDPAALLTIAGAIGRAYLPHITPRQTLRLVGKSVPPLRIFKRWSRSSRRGKFAG